MSDIPKPAAPARKTGLSPKEQKLAALRAKLAGETGKSAHSGASASGGAAKSATGFKKTSFQRKAT